MTEEEEFEFRHRLEQESQQETAEVYSGWVKGLRDPVDALSQMLYQALPESVKESGDELNNWLAEKTGLLEPIPEGGFGEQLRQQEEQYQAGRAAEGDTGVDWDRLGGNVVSTAVPGLAAAKVAAPASLSGKVATGAGTGAGYGLLTPTQEEDFWGAKGKQALTGAAVGGTIPVAGALLKGGAHYIDELTKPLYQRGIERDVKKFLVDQTGSEREKIIRAMQEAREIVPGNMPTAGQAITQAVKPGQSYGGQIVKLEKELSKTPITGSPLRARYSQQAQGRQNVINAIAGTEDNMAKAIAAREAATAPLYKAVEQSAAKVDITPVLSKIDDILAKNPNRKSVTTPLSSIRAALVDGDNSPQAISSLRGEVKDLMGKITPGGQKEYNVGALNEIKNLLDKQITSAERSYGLAQQAYKSGSVPINRMEVGKELVDALVNAAEKEAPSTFLGAMKQAPRTLKRATGFNRYDKLDDVLSAEQTQGVKNVGEELVNIGKAKAQISDIDSIMKELPGEVTLSLPHILSRPIVVTNHILNMIGKDKTPQYKAMLIDILKDPKSLEKALTLPPENTKKKMAMDILREITSLTATKEAVN